MTVYIALSDYTDATRSIRAGEDVDDRQVPLTELVRGGLAVVLSTPTSRQARDRYRVQAASNANASIVAAMGAAGVFGGGGTPPAASVTYDDTLQAPPLGAAEVQAALDAVKVDLAAIEADVVTVQGDIATVQGDLATAQGDITALQGDVTTLQGDVATLQGDLATAQADIAALQGTVGALPTLASGTYSPTITIVTPGSLVATAPEPFKYVRVGNVVKVSGRVSATSSALAAFNEITVDLPIATADPDSISGVVNGSSIPRASTDHLLTAGVVQNDGGSPGIYWTLAFSNANGQLTLGIEFSYLVA